MKTAGQTPSLWDSYSLLLCLIVGMAVSGCLLLAVRVYGEAGDDVLERLTSDEFVVREQALLELYKRADFDQNIEAWLRQTDSVEQKHRLVDAAKHHAIAQYAEANFELAGPGAMGVSHRIMPAGQPDLPVVYVADTLPGFPAHACLRPNDAILELAGQPVTRDIDQEMFANIIQQHQAGDKVGLVILRRGERMKIEIALASLQALKGIYRTSDDRGTYFAPAAAKHWIQVRNRLSEFCPKPATLTLPIDGKPTSQKK